MIIVCDERTGEELFVSYDGYLVGADQLTLSIGSASIPCKRRNGPRERITFLLVDGHEFMRAVLRVQGEEISMNVEPRAPEDPSNRANIEWSRSWGAER